MTMVSFSSVSCDLDRIETFYHYLYDDDKIWNDTKPTSWIKSVIWIISLNCAKLVFAERLLEAESVEGFLVSGFAFGVSGQQGECRSCDESWILWYERTLFFFLTLLESIWFDLGWVEGWDQGKRKDKIEPFLYFKKKMITQKDRFGENKFRKETRWHQKIKNPDVEITSKNWFEPSIAWHIKCL